MYIHRPAKLLVVCHIMQESFTSALTQIKVREISAQIESCRKYVFTASASCIYIPCILEISAHVFKPLVKMLTYFATFRELSQSRLKYIDIKWHNYAYRCTCLAGEGSMRVSCAIAEDIDFCQCVVDNRGDESQV